MKDGQAMEGGVCGAATKAGGRCKKPAGWGTGHKGVGTCRLHLGNTPAHEVKGQVELVRREMAVLGIDQLRAVHPHEVILDCLMRAHAEVLYWETRLAELGYDDVTGPVMTTHLRPAKGEYGMDRLDMPVTETRELAPEVHITVRGYHEALDRAMKFAKVAADAGIDERRQKLAESLAEPMAQAMRAFAEQLGVDPADPKVRAAMRSSLSVIAGGLAA